MFRSLIMVLLCSLSVSTQAAPRATSFGRYVGTLKHDRLNVEQLAKIDFVVSRSSGNQLEMKAVLTLHFGDFKSGEYISYHFDNVLYDILSGTFVFDQAQEGVSLVSKSFADGEMSAELFSNALGRIGTINLKMDGDAKPTLPIIEPVAGDFRSKCKGRDSIMQLHTMRSTEDSSRIGNNFGSYEVGGQFGYFDLNFCYKGKACQWASIRSGAYNFFTGTLDIVGSVNSWSCKTDAKGFTCDDGCRFDRVSDETRSRVFSPPKAIAAFPTATPPDATAPPAQVDGLAGTYTGFLHHEYLDRYQPTELSVVTYQSVENGERKLRISASARLFFNNTLSSETISYRFEPRDFPNPLMPSQFVIDRLKDDVDAFLKITSFKDGIIRGEWYSLLFGRVGTFEVRKAALGKFELPKGTKMIKSINGEYDEAWWKLKLVTFQTRTPPNSENPFFPLSIAGTLILKDSFRESRESIKGGSYDFYTGKIALQWKNEGWKSEGLVVGWRNTNDEMSLRTISNEFGSILQEYQKPRIFLSTINQEQ